MTHHGLAVRRGGITTLCNGRPQNHTNYYDGPTSLLMGALRETKESYDKHPTQSCRGIIKRFMIPQDLLREKVDCWKCRCLMSPKSRAAYMKKIYENSHKFKSRKKSSYNREYRMSVLGKRPVGRPRKIEEPQNRVEPTTNTLRVPEGKTLVLTFSVV